MAHLLMDLINAESNNQIQEKIEEFFNLHKPQINEWANEGRPLINSFHDLLMEKVILIETKEHKELLIQNIDILLKKLFELFNQSKSSSHLPIYSLLILELARFKVRNDTQTPPPNPTMFDYSVNQVLNQLSPKKPHGNFHTQQAILYSRNTTRSLFEKYWQALMKPHNDQNEVKRRTY